MLITLDTNLLIKTKLDAHQFVSLKLIQEKEYSISQVKEVRIILENAGFTIVPKINTPDINNK